MADAAEKATAVVKPVQTEEEIKKEDVSARKADSQEESDAEESETEEIVLDEPSDTENFEITSDTEGQEQAEDDDDSCSSGEEEEGVYTVVTELGGQKFLKLKFEDVEAKIKERQTEMEQENEGESQDSQPEEGEDKEKGDNVEKTEKKEESGSSFTAYRTESIMDTDMEKYYNSDEDDNFNPTYERFSDSEYSDDDERDTDNEVETEETQERHKKTGETLVCIKMIEELKIPPRDQPCSSGEISASTGMAVSQSMECS